MELVYWHWLVAGVVLMTIEMVVPAAYFIGLGAAALLVGLLMLIAPALSWEMQIIVFSVLSLVSIVLAKRLVKHHDYESDQPLLNRRGHQYVGRDFTLEEPIVNGQGKIRVDDSTWKISGSDCDSGATVTVTGVDGVVLRVEMKE